MSDASTADGPPMDHVAIAVHDADVAAQTITALCGYVMTGDEVVDAAKVRLVYLSSADGTAATRLQLVQPLGAGIVTDFLASQGEGLHHICFRTNDIARSLRNAGEVSASGIFTGGNGQPCAFLTSPVHGARIEFTEVAEFDANDSEDGRK